MIVYVVISQFTESVVPHIHVSVYKHIETAHNVAKKVNGTVIARNLHGQKEIILDSAFKLWDDELK